MKEKQDIESGCAMLGVCGRIILSKMLRDDIKTLLVHGCDPDNPGVMLSCSVVRPKKSDTKRMKYDNRI